MPVSRDLLDGVRRSCLEFAEAVQANCKELFSRPKLHMILHLPHCIEEFGRTAAFNAER